MPECSESIVEESNIFKEQGNEAFKSGDWLKALQCYTSALNLLKENNREKSILYKNRAAVYNKLCEFENAIRDCSASLDIVANDPKALFRRCCAYEQLGKHEEAYVDGKQCLLSDPMNKEIQPILSRLHPIVQAKLRDNAQLSNKIDSMFKYAFTIEENIEKRITAIKNLLVLSKESSSGCNGLLKSGIISKIKSLLKNDNHNEVRINALRIIGQLCKNDETRTKQVLVDLGVPWFIDSLNTEIQNEINGVTFIIQEALNSLTGMSNTLDSSPNEEKCKKNSKEIDAILTCLVCSVDRHSINKFARDSIIEILTRNVHYNNINWAERLIDMKGLQRLLEVAAELIETRYESKMDITEYSHTNVSVCLSTIYDNMTCDKSREKYMSAVDEFLKRMLLDPDIESKVRAVSTISVLLLGPIDVGNSIISRDGIIEMILAMATTDDKVQQRIACECIIAATSKKSKITPIVKQGTQILKNLYKSGDDDIRIRALVGLCKLGSSGGTDASIRPFSEGSTLKLAEACRRFLIHPNTNPDTKRWAVEGLSYLTLDAEVKEKLIEDGAALQAIMGLAKSEKTSAMYALVSIFVNLCNAYEKQEVIPEMIELAKFSKCHVPEDHELDDTDFVNKRIVLLCKYGIVTVLVQLSKTESINIKELISRLFNAICALPENRGEVAKLGGIKALLELAHSGSPKGKRLAAQALARIGISINPEVSFKEQRCLESIRPFLGLLHPDCSALENFESMMALCNMAGVNERVRKKILDTGGLQLIENYLFEEHIMLRRASAQCFTNLMMSHEVIQIFEGENDKLKLLFLLCEEEDEDTALAATGAVAIAVSNSDKCCKKLMTFNNWEESLKALLAHPDNAMQHRALVIAHSLIESDKEIAERVFATDIMEVLMALSILKDETKKDIREMAEKCLILAESLKLIKKANTE
ncbi:Tetratricopeptide repeat,Armadillo-like helical,Armadillo-type fold,Tetratricopeptide repeat- [Cinara cedri]|uniref:Protein unc-45 homolog B n=1 Tax=Cinara cedri TaxID=506608 RepID=A0A5E4MHJ7_9HEMI|nr:Tetratricopeptide repeat,Armadillo-like helical,Armadillo-type fold,Tetratricopeptide repeat- [Cinara cedri]